MPSLEPSRVEQIAALYVRLLGRFPDPEGLRLYLASEASIGEIEESICHGDEYRGLEATLELLHARLAAHKGARKILLVGAFGNGNLGDRAMAALIEAWVRERGLGICFAYSELNLVDYPYPTGQQLERDPRSLNARLLSLWDCLVIGGGGLLAYPHDPLWDPAWPHLIPIPYALFACGVGQPIDPRLRNLVRRATIASGRDRESVEELAKCNANTLRCPDPILALFRPPTAPTVLGRARGRCFIPRGPVTEWHRKVAAALRDEDRVVLLEAGVDWQLLYLFPNARVARSLKELASELAECEVTVSERFHGAIVSLLCGRPTIGICRGDHNSSKIRSLFDNLDIAAFCQDDNEVPGVPDPFPTNLVAAKLQGERDLFEDSAAQLLSALTPEPSSRRRRGRAPRRAGSDRHR